MSEYTAGSWELAPKTGEIRSAGHLVAKVYGATFQNHEANARECWANARLIAAAPEMYEILCEFLCICGYNEETLEDAEELIARIDGTEETE